MRRIAPVVAAFALLAAIGSPTAAASPKDPSCTKSRGITTCKEFLFSFERVEHGLGPTPTGETCVREDGTTGEQWVWTDERQLVRRYTVRTYRGSNLLSEVDTEEYEVLGLDQTFSCL
jgi:hypothetical protein